mgnify:CR=1 FL=1
MRKQFFKKLSGNKSRKCNFGRRKNMLFTSFIFLQIFLPAVLITDALMKKIKYKNFFLLIASLLFYAWGEPENIFLILISLFFNYLIAMYGLDFRKSEKTRKWMLTSGIVFNIGILMFFKYTSPFIQFLDNIFDLPFKYSNIALPLGISFFTFQIMSYLLDTFRKENEPQKNFFDLALYIMLFPQLVAGPIVKYHDIARSLEQRCVTMADYTVGIRRFIYGLSKKVLIANQMAYLADDIFLVPGEILDSKTAWLGIVAYSLQIYFDFSGYSDMAIGIGRMLGFKFKENFNLPYAAKSIQDFWRRWHISLSSWFKEYLYIPLGGSRVSEKRIYLNIMIVFAATGIWHGAGLNFIIWGLYYGVLLVLERWKLRNIFERKHFSFLAHVYTLLAVQIGWVFFRAETFLDAAGYCRTMFDFSNNPDLAVSSFLTPISGVLLVAAILLSAPVPMLKIFCDETTRTQIRWFDYPLQGILLGASLLLLAGNTYNPFIYFRF